MGQKTRKIYYPRRYYQGLSKTNKIKRKNEIIEFGKMPWTSSKAYVGFKTDIGVKTKKSNYTIKWRKQFPDAKSLDDKSDVTGVPLKYIRESYNRGMAAWRTGHRPGATQQQWGYARVHSFLLCGKTHYSTDSDLVRKAKEVSTTARKWWSGQGC